MDSIFLVGSSSFGRPNALYIRPRGPYMFGASTDAAPALFSCPDAPASPSESARAEISGNATAAKCLPVTGASALSYGSFLMGAKQAQRWNGSSMYNGITPFAYFAIFG